PWAPGGPNGAWGYLPALGQGQGDGPDALPGGGIDFNVISAGGNAILSSAEEIQGDEVMAGGLVNITTDTRDDDHGNDLHIAAIIAKQLVENGVTIYPHGRFH